MAFSFAQTSLIVSGDGSHTLKNELTGEHYHSIFGALTESKHVFVEAGLKSINPNEGQIRLLEIGLGTGLNLLLSAVHANSLNLRIDYTGLEPFPVQPLTINELNYGKWLNEAVFSSFCEHYEALLSGQLWELGGLTARMDLRPILDFESKDQYDLIFYDAFSPTSQAEMWLDGVVDKLSGCLASGGVLVTYCVRGYIRRRFLVNGLQAERLPGPPGKRQMLRITKP